MSPYRPITSYAPGGYAPPPYAPSGFQLADFIRVLDARRSLILRMTLATVICALVIALCLPTVFSSSATVLLDPRKNSVTDLSAVVSPLTTDPATVQNQIQIITSRGLAASVVDRLQLTSDPEFNAAIAAPGLGDVLSALNPRNWFDAQKPTSLALQRERVIDALRRHVWADAQGLSTTIAISASSRDAAKSARIANAVADAYVKNQISNKIDATNATTDWLNRRISDLALQLELQQAAIQRYKATHNLNDSAPGGSIIDQQMVGISTQVVAARSDLAQKEAVAGRINQLIKAGTPADVTQIVASPLIIQLRTQQATLLAQQSDLTSKYGPLHPKMQGIEEQKRDLDTKIAQEVSRLAASAANDVMVARAHLNSLQGSLGGTESTARTQNMDRVQLQAMESNATSTKTMYEAFVQRLRQSQNLDDVQTPESRVISTAAVPLSPSGPKRSLIVGASLPLGLLLGILAALLVEKFGPLMPVKVNGAPLGALLPETVRSRVARTAPGRPKTKLHPATMWNGPPILGEVNDPAQLRAADFVLDYPTSKYAHAIAGLVRELETKPNTSGGGATVAVTSGDNGESRSAIAVSLARAASKMGKKAIIVDCAPARLTAKALKARVKVGLYDVLSGTTALKSALVKDPRSETYLLATPTRPDDSLSMFSSRPMAKLVAVLRAGADFVVLDCGAAAGTAEAAVIARLADVTLLVSRRDQLHSPLTANAIRALEQAHAAAVGIVTTK
jgi:uncharacterized protein involved in exopolysaccharide biosynthesis/Mrp family chromosome partitioning ATPase